MAAPSKSEAATPKRREEARQRGQVARSTELTSALSLLGILTVLNLSGSYMLQVMGPLLLGAVVIGVAVNVLQFGFLFAPEALQLRWENLSPARGFGRLFSRRTAVEVFKSFLKIGVIGGIAWLTIAC